MSDTADLDIKEQITRINRSIEETRKFVAEQRKLMEEAGKLTAEAAKMNRERKLAPLVLFGTFLAALVGALASLVAKHFGA